MRLAQRTDVAVRILMYLSIYDTKVVPLYNLVDMCLSGRPQVVKVTQILRQNGYISSSQGPKGGVWITKDPSTISLSEIVNLFEADFHLTDYFDSSANGEATLARFEVFNDALSNALGSFMSHLEKVTIADVAHDLEEHLTAEQVKAARAFKNRPVTA